MTLEEKEIKGVTAKLVIWLVIHTALIVGTACGFYFNIRNDISRLVIKREDEEKYWQLKFDQLQIQNSVLQRQLDGIEVRMDKYLETTKQQ